MNAASKSPVSNMSSRLIRTARWRYAHAWIITLATGAVGALFWGAVAFCLVAIAVSLPDLSRRAEMPYEQRIWFDFGLNIAIGSPVLLYVGLYLLPFVLTLPVSSPIIALWQAPPRFLLLRPFNRRVLSRPLKRIARRELAPLGHIYTLSDADINVPWYIRIPILLGQLALFSFRIHRIRNANQIKGIERALGRTWLRNVNWCMSFGKVFPVASSNACWREVVDCLLKRSSALIVDVSDLRENVTWEIDHARRLGFETRTLYLISSDRADCSPAAVTQALGAEACASRLFRYGRDGLADSKRFKAALAETIVADTTVENGWQRTHAPNRLAIAATVAFVIGFIPVFALAFPGFGEPFLPRWNPWESPEQWPGIAKVINTKALVAMAFGLATWFLLILASKRTQTIRFLLVIQTLLLLAAPIGMVEDWFIKAMDYIPSVSRSNTPKFMASQRADLAAQV